MRGIGRGRGARDGRGARGDRRRPIAWVLWWLGLSACGAQPPAVAPTLSSAPQVVAAPRGERAEAKAADAPAIAPAAAEPTTPSDAQRAREAALAPSVEAVLAGFDDEAGRVTRDHRRVVFASNRDGAWGAYMGDVAKPSAPPRRLSHGGERALDPRLTSDEAYALWRVDHDGDERFAIVRANPDGSGVVTLADGDGLQRDAPLSPRLRPREIVYAARGVDPLGTTIFVRSLRDGEAPRKAFTDPHAGAILDVSPDGARALYARTIGPNEQVLLRVDLDDGSARRLFPQSERRHARITAARFSSDGKRVFVATDDGGEGALVVRLEPDNGVVSGRYVEEQAPNAALRDLAASPTEDRVAFTVDAGDHTEVRVLDASLRPTAPVKLPLGVARVVDFSPDGKAIAITLATPERPTETYEVDATTGALRPLHAEPRAGLAALAKVDVTTPRIAAHDGRAIPIVARVPWAAAKRGPLPVIVWLHDGPAQSSAADWSALAALFAERGWAWVAPNVRGSTGFGRAYALAADRERQRDAVADVVAVRQWLAAQPWADPERVVVAGEGLGGTLALLAAAKHPAAWRAVIDLYAPTDLRAWLAASPPWQRAPLASALGDPDQDAALLEAGSPLAVAGSIRAPVLVYQGANDPRVPRRESDALVTALRRRGAAVEYVVGEGEGHGAERRETKIALWSRMARFLEETAARPASSGAVAAAAETEGGLR